MGKRSQRRMTSLSMEQREAQAKQRQQEEKERRRKEITNKLRMVLGLPLEA